MTESSSIKLLLLALYPTFEYIKFKSLKIVLGVDHIWSCNDGVIYG